MASDFKEAALIVYQVFRELANREMSLAISLQGFIPSNKATSSLSAQYLRDHAVMLIELSEQVKAAFISPGHSHNS